MTLSDALKQRILELCKERKITLNKLCTNAGLPHTTLVSFFTNKTKILKIDTLYLLCEGLGISMSMFFDSPLFSDIEEE